MSDATGRISIPSEMTPALLSILGRPNFTCRNIAGLLRESGFDIARKSEEEQAHTLLFLLRHYAASGESWDETASAELKCIAQSIRDRLEQE